MPLPLGWLLSPPNGRGGRDGDGWGARGRDGGKHDRGEGVRPFGKGTDADKLGVWDAKPDRETKEPRHRDGQGRGTEGRGEGKGKERGRKGTVFKAEHDGQEGADGQTATDGGQQVCVQA